MSSSRLYTPTATASAADAAQCVATLRTLIGNILQNPDTARFRRVRLANTRFHQHVGQHAPGLRLLELSGFSRDADQGELVYRRNDLGLLWLARDVLDSSSGGCV